MGSEEKSCDLGVIRVVGLGNGTGYLMFEFDGELNWDGLDGVLMQDADRTEGIDMFTTKLSIDIAKGYISAEEANARVIFDDTVKDDKKAYKCLELFTTAVARRLTDISDETIQRRLDLNVHKELDENVKAVFDQGRRGQQAADSSN